MRNNILIRLLMVTALLILAVPVVASAQIYSRDRYNNRDRYNDDDERAVREAINRLENSSARLERDVNVPRGRRVLGMFWVERNDNNAVAEIRDFRRAVRELRDSSNNGRALGRSRDEAAVVLDRGVRLDRNLRLRTGSSYVDADLSELRSNLHIIADAYGLNVPY